MLCHYKWIHSEEEKEEIDLKTKNRYENKLSDWMAIEAIVKERDREIQAANIARLSGKQFIFCMKRIDMLIKVFCREV